MPAAHIPTAQTRATVESMAAYGIPQDEIAATLGIAPKTLRKAYRDELDTAATKANARVGQFLYRAASGAAIADGATQADCIRAAMFWAKTRMGWRETNNLEVAGKDGGPIQTETTVSDDLRQALDAIAGKIAAGAGAGEMAGHGTPHADSPAG